MKGEREGERRQRERGEREREKERETNGVHHTLPLKLPDIQQIS